MNSDANDRRLLNEISTLNGTMKKIEKHLAKMVPVTIDAAYFENDIQENTND